MLASSINLEEIMIFMTDCDYQGIIRFIHKRTLERELRLVTIQTMQTVAFSNVYEETKDLRVRNFKIGFFELNFEKGILTPEVLMKLEHGQEVQLGDHRVQKMTGEFDRVLGSGSKFYASNFSLVLNSTSDVNYR